MHSQLDEILVLPAGEVADDASMQREFDRAQETERGELTPPEPNGEAANE
jgi:hypothetical protein